MNTISTDGNLTLVNFIVVFYFISLGLINLLEIDYFLIGFLSELLTIPFLITLFVLIFIGLKKIITKPKIHLNSLSVLFLVITALIIIGSFF